MSGAGARAFAGWAALAACGVPRARARRSLARQSGQSVCFESDDLNGLLHLAQRIFILLIAELLLHLGRADSLRPTSQIARAAPRSCSIGRWRSSVNATVALRTIRCGSHIPVLP